MHLKKGDEGDIKISKGMMAFMTLVILGLGTVGTIIGMVYASSFYDGGEEEKIHNMELDVEDNFDKIEKNSEKIQEIDKKTGKLEADIYHIGVDIGELKQNLKNDLDEIKEILNNWRKENE